MWKKILKKIKHLVLGYVDAKTIRKLTGSIVINSICIKNGYVELNGISFLPSEEKNNKIKEVDSKNPFGERHKNEIFIKSYQYEYRSDFVCEIENVGLLGPKGLGVDRRGNIIEDTIQMPGHNRLSRALEEAVYHEPLLSLNMLRGGYEKSCQLERVGTASTLFSSWSNYYHWILEHLVKIRAIEYYYEDRKIKPKIIIPDNPSSFITETLDLIGYDKSLRISWSSPAMWVERLVLPTYPEANADNLTWLRSRMKRSIPERVDTSISEYVYISRSQAPKRRIINEEYLAGELSKLGFDIVIAEDFSVAEQISMFSSAKVIVGPHGAGLTNMIWADNASIVEIHGRCIMDHYSVLANNLQHKYIPIRGKTKKNGKNSDIYVDINRVKSVLSSIIK